MSRLARITVDLGVDLLLVATLTFGAGMAFMSAHVGIAAGLLFVATTRAALGTRDVYIALRNLTNERDRLADECRAQIDRTPVNNVVNISVARRQQ